MPHTLQGLGDSPHSSYGGAANEQSRIETGLK